MSEILGYVVLAIGMCFAVSGLIRIWRAKTPDEVMAIMFGEFRG